MPLWFQLPLCLSIIGYAGCSLSSYDGIIVGKPGISAVTLAGAPNIAVGDALGSTLFNLAILARLGARHRRETQSNCTAQWHILPASLGAILIAFAGFSLLLNHARTSPAFWHLAPCSPFILLVYLVSMRVVYSYERCTASKFAKAIAE